MTPENIMLDMYAITRDITSVANMIDEDLIRSLEYCDEGEKLEALRYARSGRDKLPWIKNLCTQLQYRMVDASRWMEPYGERIYPE